MKHNYSFIKILITNCIQYMFVDLLGDLLKLIVIFKL